MAHAKPTTQKDPALEAERPTTALPAVQQTTALATSVESMFAEDAAAGMEGADSDSYAIPFLSALQALSPQVDESDAKFVSGAKAGMLYENITGRLIDGKTGAIIVPCHFRRVFLRWGPRSGEGAGFKGELTPEQVAAMRSKREIVDVDGRLFVPMQDGTVNEKRCDRIVDTRNHYVLLVDEATGAAVQALLSLRSTQIKKSKALMSALASVRVPGAGGAPVQPASFANVVRLTTVQEKNDEGTWYGVKFAVEGRVQSAALYQQAKAFYETVKKGAVEVKYEEALDEDGATKGGQPQQRRAAPADQSDNRF